MRRFDAVWLFYWIAAKAQQFTPGQQQARRGVALWKTGFTEDEQTISNNPDLSIPIETVQAQVA